MTYWKTLGHYLSRPVNVAEWAESSQPKSEQVESSVILLVLGSAMPKESLQTLLGVLINMEPLAIAVTGYSARAAFDVLIAGLSDGKPRKHVMTKLVDSKDMEVAVEEFLQSTWPSEDRFDEWTAYGLIKVEHASTDVEEAVRRLCA